MKSKPKNFEPFIDADGGEWIKIKVGQFRDTVWRPVDMSLDEQPDGSSKLNFQVEFLTEPVTATAFQKMAGSILYSILQEEIDAAQ